MMGLKLVRIEVYNTNTKKYSFRNQTCFTKQQIKKHNHEYQK